MGFQHHAYRNETPENRAGEGGLQEGSGKAAGVRSIGAEIWPSIGTKFLQLIGRFMGRIGIRARKKGEKKEGREPEWNRLLLLLLLLWLLEVVVVVVLREEGHLPWDWLIRFGEDDASREREQKRRKNTNRKRGRGGAKTVRDGKGGRGSCLVMGSKHDSTAVDVLIYQIVGGLSCTPLASEHIGGMKSRPAHYEKEDQENKSCTESK
ncbi:hypothetical protein B296_00054607 [Ensete ventricosum]|uniref:Uncharacterized protein n=1 Tax=Ensete ventricosum TaxID=4639 RepID=A0A426Y377_ENSVE|nr:hypothetical protein B296_00054607 [Ensete ventricosum]